jgi:serine/threonine-protein phosphatase 5
LQFPPPRHALRSHQVSLSLARAIQLDASFAKAYYRRASAHLSILDAKAALPDLRKVAQLEPRNAAVRAQLDATTKLLRRMQFEKAIAKDEGPKNWQTAARHLKEGSGGTQVPESYEGPRLEEGEEGTEEEMYSKGTHLGKITQVSCGRSRRWGGGGRWWLRSAF